MQKYGQHFLIDKNIIAQITDAVFLLRAEQLVEIGPGKGALTTQLVARGEHALTAIEIDPEMVSYLALHVPQVQVVQSDFLAFDLANLKPVPTTFASNLPYIDAAAILDKVLAWPHFQTAVFMFQKEHTQKIRARAGDDFYGPLSILSQLRARISLVCKVGRSAFAPPPKVESAVLAFERLTPPEVPWETLRRVVEQAFLHRRKTLLNALTLSGYDKEKTARALTVLARPLTVRPEELTPQDYVVLARELVS